MLVIPRVYIERADFLSLLKSLRKREEVSKYYFKLRNKSSKDKEHVYLLPVHIRDLRVERGNLSSNVVIVFNNGTPSLRPLDKSFLHSTMPYSKVMLLIAEASTQIHRPDQPFFIKIKKEDLRKINKKVITIAIKRWRKNRIKEFWDYIGRNVQLEFGLLK